MTQEQVNFLKSILQIRGIQLVDYASDEASCFDLGLRGQLYQNFEYDLLQRLWTSTEFETLYRCQDEFHLHYFFWKVQSEAGQEMYTAGPFLIDEDPYDLEHIIRSHQFPASYFGQLENFYSGLPRISAADPLESELPLLLEQCYGSRKFPLNAENTIGYYSYLDVPYSTRNTEAEHTRQQLSMTAMMQRYQDEKQLVEAIRRGDYTSAASLVSSMKKYSPDEWQDDRLRLLKNYLISENALFRMAVYEAQVHPFYIDRLSSTFPARIEAASDPAELDKIYLAMVHKYCLLVQEHSLAGFSPSIREALNYIEFHLSEPLGLKELAEQLNVTASHLSAQFKKETGSTLTAYIADKRIEKSLPLLVTTDLQIQEIAERVGIYDENYFSKLFKKKYGLTARDYRRKIIQQKTGQGSSLR